MFRWLIPAVLLSAITVSGYHRARARLGGETVARRREEHALLAKFGERYETYMQRTGRLVPRVRTGAVSGT